MSVSLVPLFLSYSHIQVSSPPPPPPQEFYCLPFSQIRAWNSSQWIENSGDSLVSFASNEGPACASFEANQRTIIFKNQSCNLFQLKQTPNQTTVMYFNPGQSQMPAPSVIMDSEFHNLDQYYENIQNGNQTTFVLSFQNESTDRQNLQVSTTQSTLDDCGASSIGSLWNAVSTIEGSMEECTFVFEPPAHTCDIKREINTTDCCRACREENLCAFFERTLSGRCLLFDQKLDTCGRRLQEIDDEDPILHQGTHTTRRYSHTSSSYSTRPWIVASIIFFCILLATCLCFIYSKNVHSFSFQINA